MNSMSLHRLTMAGLTLGAVTLITSCTAAPGPVEHGKVIDKRSRPQWTETVTEDIYNCRTVTTRAARSSLATGKGGGTSSRGRGSSRGGSGLVGGLFGDRSAAKAKPKPKGEARKPGPGGHPKTPSRQQRRDCTKAGERKVPRIHPGRYELHIKAKDGRTAWKNVTASFYRDVRKGDKV